MAMFQVAWSGEVEGNRLTAREDPYTLELVVTDHDGNEDRATCKFHVAADTTPPTVEWSMSNSSGIMVSMAVTGANTLETAPWFCIVCMAAA